MNREELKALGLTNEQIDSVMASHGKALNATKDKADKVEGLESQIEDYKTQLTDRDTQLADLKKGVKDNEELTARITELENNNEKQKFDFSLEKALTGAKVRNPKAVMALLDAEKIKLDGQTLLGLDDQLTAIKETDPYLFQQEQTPPNSPQITTRGNPNGGGSGTVTKEQIMSEKDNNARQRLIRENSHLFQNQKLPLKLDIQFFAGTGRAANYLNQIHKCNQTLANWMQNPLITLTDSAETSVNSSRHWALLVKFQCKKDSRLLCIAHQLLT